MAPAASAMSTIPTTSSALRAAYTVFGGSSPRMDYPPLSAIVLSRGPKAFARALFEDLERNRFRSILSVESSGHGQDSEGSRPGGHRLRTILLKERLSPGEAINIAMQEAMGDYCLVLWNDMRLEFPLIGPPLIERLRSAKALCLCPRLRGPGGQELPCLVNPALGGDGTLRLLSLMSSEGTNDAEGATRAEGATSAEGATRAEGSGSLFPFDYCGIYDRSRFILAGGYDPTIIKPWWQKADFGFRAHLWGERIRLDSSWGLSYASDTTSEDTEADESYARFFLKNLAIRRERDSGRLPLKAFLPWASRAGLGLSESIRTFSACRRWVAVNRYRFLIDSRGLAELWRGLGQ